MKSKQHFAPPLPSTPHLPLVVCQASCCLSPFLAPLRNHFNLPAQQWVDGKVRCFLPTFHTKTKTFVCWCFALLSIFSPSPIYSPFLPHFSLFCCSVWFVLLLIEWSYLVFGRGYIRALRQSSLGSPATWIAETFGVMSIAWADVKYLSFYLLNSQLWSLYNFLII